MLNGAYPKNDGTVGQIPLGKEGKPIYNHYNTDAVLGGAYWNLTSLLGTSLSGILQWISLTVSLLVYKRCWAG